jgi:hypothetical protein
VAKPTRLTLAQIATVLHAVARVECWDARHRSVAVDRITGEWRSDGNGNALPSTALLKEVRKLEAHDRREDT